MAIQIKKFKIITIDRAIIYGGIFLAMLAGNVAICIQPGPKLPGLPIGLAMLVGAGFIIEQLLWPRVLRARSIRFYTSQGMAIIPADWASPDFAAIDAAISEVVTWWTAKMPEVASQFPLGFNGGSLAVIVSDTPLEDKRFNIKARGLTYGGDVQALWEPKNSGQDFYEIVKHEFSHVCLNAIGHPVEDQHAFMAAQGCPWK